MRASSANARENSRSPVAIATARPADGGDGRAPSAQQSTVDHVIVDERRGVHELDGHRGAHRRSSPLPVRGGPPTDSAASTTSSGRRRLPPARIVAFAWPAANRPQRRSRARDDARRAIRSRNSSPPRRMIASSPSISPASSCRFGCERCAHRGRALAARVLSAWIATYPAGEQHIADLPETGALHLPSPGPPVRESA